MSTWNNDLVLEFIELYKKEEVLWDPKHPAHKNRNEVSDAWVRIQLSFSLTCSIVDLKRKKESLMTSFRLHLNRKRTQEGYNPQWFAFSLMESFLGGKYECDSSTMEHDKTVQDHEIENFLQHWQSSEENSEDDDGEYFTTYNIQQPDPISTRTNVRGNTRQLKTSHQNRLSKTTSESKKPDIKPSCSKNTEETELDEYDLYGQLLAKKLRKLDEHQRDVTMHEIDNLMFRAKMQSSGSYSSPPSPRKVKSPLFILAPSSNEHYEDENLPYQEHMQPPEPS